MQTCPWRVCCAHIDNETVTNRSPLNYLPFPCIIPAPNLQSHGLADLNQALRRNVPRALVSSASRLLLHPFSYQLPALPSCPFSSSSLVPGRRGGIASLAETWH